MSRPALQQLAPHFCPLSHCCTIFDFKNDSCPAGHLTGLNQWPNVSQYTALATPPKRWDSLRTDAHFVSSTLCCGCYRDSKKISTKGQVGDTPCYRMCTQYFWTLNANAMATQIRLRPRESKTCCRQCTQADTHTHTQAGRGKSRDDRGSLYLPCRCKR